MSKSLYELKLMTKEDFENIDIQLEFYKLIHRIQTDEDKIKKLEEKINHFITYINTRYQELSHGISMCDDIYLDRALDMLKELKEILDNE